MALRGRKSLNRTWGISLGLAVLVVCATGVEGQLRGSRMATRAQLTALVDSLQQRVPSVEDDDDRRFMEEQIAWIGQRLREGDVRPGDVVRLRVTGQERWSSDFTVNPTGHIELPDVDDLDMTGTLYSEVEEAISRQLGRYLREPRIDAEVLKRVGILGAVENPGFYTVEGDMLVSDVIMTAGGPNEQAKVDDVAFRRQGSDLNHPDQLVWQNLSLDQLGIQSGDEVYVPQQGRSFPAIMLGVIGSAASLTWLMIRIF